MKTCPHCNKPCPPNYVTCGGSTCQEKETKALIARGAGKKRKRRR